MTRQPAVSSNEKEEHVYTTYNMVDRSQLPNAFEFVVVAAARAKQLLQGCVPKVEPSLKPARTAMREVLVGQIDRVDAVVTSGH